MDAFEQAKARLQSRDRHPTLTDWIGFILGWSFVAFVIYAILFI